MIIFILFSIFSFLHKNRPCVLHTLCHEFLRRPIPGTLMDCMCVCGGEGGRVVGGARMVLMAWLLVGTGLSIPAHLEPLSLPPRLPPLACPARITLPDVRLHYYASQRKRCYVQGVPCSWPDQLLFLTRAVKARSM